MPSKAHSEAIEKIEREIKSRSIDWRTKRNFLVWLPKDNVFGSIDIAGFKKANQFSPAEAEAYEVEESNGSSQVHRNFEKLEQFKKSFPANVRVRVCQLNANENHRIKCPRTTGEFRR